jgi:uncharacterized protein
VNTHRIVIDSTVYLSALLFGGNPRTLVETALRVGAIVIILEEIYTEMLKVVSMKFPQFLDEYRAFEVILRENTILIPLGSVTVQVSRDAKDNMILETACIGGAHIIVTCDKDLLVICSYQEIMIVTPAELLGLQLFE